MTKSNELPEHCRECGCWECKCPKYFPLKYDKEYGLFEAPDGRVVLVISGGWGQDKKARDRFAEKILKKLNK